MSDRFVWQSDQVIITKKPKNDIDTTDNGGAGSGNYGHAGRPGKIGGSSKGFGSGQGFLYTESEAIEATKDSKYTKAVGHGTSRSAAESLRDDGFDSKKSGASSGKAVLGNGMYLSDNSAVTDYFARQTAYAEYAKSTNFPNYKEFNKDYAKGKSGVSIMARVDVKNPRVFKDPSDYDSETAKYAVSKGYIKNSSEFEVKYSDGFSKGEIAAEYGNELLKNHDSIIIEKDDMGIMTKYGSGIGDNTTILVRDSENIYPYEVKGTK